MLRIFGDPVSGNCLKAKWTCDLLGIPHEWVDQPFLAGETRQAEFLAINPMGQIPAVILEDGETLAQSNAIILYLNRKYGGGLLPRDPLAYGRVLQWMFWEQYTHEPAIAVRRALLAIRKLPEAELDPGLLVRGNAALALMQRALEGRDHLVGPGLTAADIALVAYTRVAHEGGFNLADYPDVERWVAITERELGLAPARSALPHSSLQGTH